MVKFHPIPALNNKIKDMQRQNIATGSEIITPIRRSGQYLTQLFTILVLMISLTVPMILFAQAPPQKDEKSIHVAVPFDFDGNFDPVDRNLINLTAMFNALYSTLFKLDSHLHPYPFLLEKYKQSGETVTFDLHRDTRFSDGTSITATDVIRSIEAGMVHNAFPNPVYKMIQGG